MSQLRIVRIKLFGIFRTMSPNSEVEIHVPLRAPVSELKMELERHWEGKSFCGDLKSLLSRSVFADEVRVLGNSEVFDPQKAGTSVLSLLPPVCGG